MVAINNHPSGLGQQSNYTTIYPTNRTPPRLLEMCYHIIKEITMHEITIAILSIMLVAIDDSHNVDKL